MKITIGMKAELVLTFVMGIEFLCVSILVLLNQKTGIFLITFLLAFYGIFRTVTWTWLIRISPKNSEDEFVTFVDENGRLVGAIAGILMLAQLAAFEVITGTVISALDSFFAVFVTFLIVYIVAATIPLNVGLGEESEEQVEHSTAQE